IVVCATEGSLAAGIFPNLPEQERSFLAKVRYNSLGIVHYQLDRQVGPETKFFAREAAGMVSTWQQVPGDEVAGQAPPLYSQLWPEATEAARRLGFPDRLDEWVGRRVRELYPDLVAHCIVRRSQWIVGRLQVFYPGYASATAAF